MVIGTELFYEVRIPLPENYDGSLFDSSINQSDNYTSRVRGESPQGAAEQRQKKGRKTAEAGSKVTLRVRKEKRKEG